MKRFIVLQLFGLWVGVVLGILGILITTNPLLFFIIFVPAIAFFDYLVSK